MPVPITDNTKILDLKNGANGVSDDVPSRNYTVVRITVITSGGYDGKLTVVTSDSDVPINLNNTADESNQYSPAEVVDIDDQSVSYPGSTGLTFSSDGVRRFEINENRVATFGLIASGATQGNIVVYSRQYEN